MGDFFFSTLQVHLCHLCHMGQAEGLPVSCISPANWAKMALCVSRSKFWECCMVLTLWYWCLMGGMLAHSLRMLEGSGHQRKKQASGQVEAERMIINSIQQASVWPETS